MDLASIVKGALEDECHASVSVFASRPYDSNVYAITSRSILQSEKVFDSFSDEVGYAVQAPLKFDEVDAIRATDLVGYFKIKHLRRKTKSSALKKNVLSKPEKSRSRKVKVGSILPHKPVFISEKGSSYVEGKVVGLNASFKVLRSESSQAFVVRNSIRVRLKTLTESDRLKDMPIAGKHVLNELGELVGIVIGGAEEFIFIAPLLDWAPIHGFELSFELNRLVLDRGAGLNPLTIAVAADPDARENGYISLIKENRSKFSKYFTELAEKNGVSAMEQLQDETVRVLVAKFGLETIVGLIFQLEIDIDPDGSSPNENWVYRSLVDRQGLAFPTSDGKGLSIGKTVVPVPVVTLHYEEKYYSEGDEANYLMGANRISPILGAS